VFLHSTTWETKHWPETYWIELAQKFKLSHKRIVLLWNNEQELQRAQRIATQAPHVEILPRLTLTQIAGVLQKAQGVVTVDTGLGHLATALGIPTVALFGPTDPARSGMKGGRNLSVDYPCAPCFGRKCVYQNQDIQPPCFTTLSVERVWEALQ
jgi:heptosyltransferase-1